MGMKIKLKTLFGMGRVYEFNVEPTTTFGELQNKLFEKLGIESTQCRNELQILFNDEVLNNVKRSLSSYNMCDGSELVISNPNLTARNGMNFGIKFVDVSNKKNLTRIGWGTNAPIWYIAGRGLCLEGICMNESCPAYNQKVIMSMGYIKFDMASDPDANTTVCPVPSCNQFVQPLTCAFNNCWWRFEGKMVNNNSNTRAPVTCSNDWQYADNAYHRFNEDNNETVTWRKLIVEVVAEEPNMN